MGFLDTVNLEKTIRDFEFTRRADIGMNSVISSEDFLVMDAEMIFEHLLSEMTPVSFKDYLKRYIYEHFQIREPFRSVTDQTYREIILQSFSENMAPFTLTPSKKRKSAIVKGWLKSDTVRRPTIFALGFGLRMSPEKVSEFLTKVLKEEDFILDDPQEVVYRYCFRKGYPYYRAEAFLDEYENRLFASSETVVPGEEYFRNSLALKELVIKDDEHLMQYLLFLKKKHRHNASASIAFEEYENLLFRVKLAIASMYNDDVFEGSTEWSPDKVGMSDIEKVICSGIPVNQSGNLVNMKASKLADQFQHRRLSRQRLAMLNNRKLDVERFDLITLLFFVYTQEQMDELPEVRCRKFMGEINGILRRCNMTNIYSVNPYEAFILMCLLTDFPLDVYADIWEMSYQE